MKKPLTWRQVIDDFPVPNVYILGKWVYVGFDKNMDECGVCYPRQCSIFLNPTLCLAQIRDTLWHEVLHQIMYETGIASEMEDKDLVVNEEMVVRRVATASLEVLRDNPDLADFLFMEDPD